MALKPLDDYGLLWRALAISLLLHVVLLLQPGIGTSSSPATGAKSLMAMLRSGTRGPVAEAHVSPPALLAVHTPSAAHENPATRASAATSAAKPQTQTDVMDTSATNVADSADSGVERGLNAAGSTDTDFAEGKKSYLFAIAAEARRVKKYPPRALAAGWTGTAEIHIVVTTGGNAQPPQLQKSSGHAEIDEAALSFVSIALKRTPVPEQLRARNFDFVLPVNFSINDK